MYLQYVFYFSWVGAWWIGFLVFAVLLLILAPWLCIFPKSMDVPVSSKPTASSSSSADDNVTDDDDVYDSPPAQLTSGKLSGKQLAVRFYVGKWQ